jgi:hypothetical protein
MAAGPPKAEQEPYDGAGDQASATWQAPLPLWRGFRRLRRLSRDEETRTP